MIEKKISLLVPDVSSQGTTRGYIIAQGLQKLGYQVKLFGFIFGEQMYPESPYGLPIAYIGGSKLPGLIKTAFKFLKDIDGDILYVMKPQLTSLGVALLKSWRGKKPIILDFDDWEMAKWGGDEWQHQGNLLRDFLPQDGKLRNPYHPFYLKWLEKSIDRVNGITVTSKFLEYRYGGTYLPNAVDTNVYDPSNFDTKTIREKSGLDGFKLLMFNGTAKPNQGVENILTALQQLNNPQLRLVLVGGNPQYEDYRQELYEKWQPWVVLIKPQPFQQTAAIVSIADMMIVTPPESDTNVAKCPLELLESMAMAKTIIATKVGEIPAIVGNTGYLVPPQNPGAIAEQINFILENEQEAQNRGKLARQRCLDKYSMNNLTKALEQIMTLASYSM